MNEIKISNKKLEWFALEYEEKERSKDWFWALGIAVIASAVASIIYANYFFAALIILGGVMLGFFAIKKPDMVHHELNEAGVKIGTHLYPYENIKSYWIEIGPKPTFFIKSERLLMPIISMPIENTFANEIYNRMFAHNIIEEEMHEHPSMQVIEFFGL